MKFPYQMLRDFVDTDLDAHQIGDLLTMAGFELEGIESNDECRVSTDESEPQTSDLGPRTSDFVLDIKVMANRGDGLSVLGLAREVLAKDAGSKPTELYQQAVKRFPESPTPTPPSFTNQNEGGASDLVTIQTPNCTRYACRLFKGDFGKPTPNWIKSRLAQAGMRPISLLVDLTNYVMLEVGQPLHAFDFNTLKGGKIVVRQAREGEKLTTLDGNEHELNPGQMMICDAERPVAAAGIMGGAETEVTGSTTTMLLESAHFVNTSVRKTRKQLGLNTDASYRFERSVDPDGVVAALNRFAMLLAEVDGGASAVPGLIDVYTTPPQPKPLILRMSRSDLLLGMHVEPSDAQRYLSALGFQVEGNGEPFQVTHPTWRIDIEREDDLIEEIGRVHGYDRIPECNPQGTTTQGGVFGLAGLVDRIKLSLLRSGFAQVINYSFETKDPLDDPWVEKFGPRNPTSPEMGMMRSSLYPGLAQAARRNGGRDLHLFEIGRVFGIAGGQIHERQAIALLSTGALVPEHWVKAAAPQADFFSLKGALEGAFSSVGLQLKMDQGHQDPRLHSTRQAAILSADGAVAGHFGQIHPMLAKECDLPEGTVLAHFFPELLIGAGKAEPKLKSISRNPAVRRDIAFLIGKDVPYSRVEESVAAACGEVLEKLWVFDVYEGKGVPEGQCSIAIALQLRKQGENFTDEEANRVRDLAVAALAPLGGSVRA
ncbi:MAG: phenylalanine--tRNA ligase subunit beta [Armatimonadetes bacterium]|nr:phenylalanine--tRNA ligase subunit beta [Armatimonadota bacterium]